MPKIIPKKDVAHMMELLRTETILSVATQFGIHRNTITRVLAREGTSVSRIKNEYRYNLIRHMDVAGKRLSHMSHVSGISCDVIQRARENHNGS